MADKEGAKYRATRTYTGAGPKSRMEILRDNISMGKNPSFDVNEGDEETARKKADEYASELQRETRGMKSGGKVSSASKRADGIAQRGKTRGKIM